MSDQTALNVQSTALQLEHVDEMVALYLQRDDALYGRIDEATDAISVSTRNARFPIQVTNGSQFSQTSADNADMGVGGADDYEVLQLSIVFFDQAVSIAKLPEVATDSKGKAVRDYAKEQMQASLAQFRSGLESLYQSDGSGTLDTIVTASSGSGSGAMFSNITVNNANNFQDSQIIQVFPNVGGVTRGTFQISSVDSLGKTLWSSQALPSTGGATQAGDILVVNGASGAAGASLLGLKYYQVNSNTGSLLGLNRSSFPGKLSTPTVNLNGNAITIQALRRMVQLTRVALGDQNPAAKDIIFYAGLDQQAAVENLHLQVAKTIQNEVKNSGAPVDMGTKEPSDEVLGRELFVSVHASAGRIDALCLKNWGRLSTVPVSLYDVGGQNVFPRYGASGGIQTSSQWYYWTGQNLVNRNVRAGAYAQNCGLPSGY
jgi:hypothetical protein